MKKKILSIMLTVVMVLSAVTALPFTAFAADKADTISDILPADFPIISGETVPENAWVNSDGDFCARKQDGTYDDLYFGVDLDNWARISCDCKVTECAEGYKCVDGSKTIIFNMENGVLASITFTKDGDPDYDGTYASAEVATHDLVITKNGDPAIEGTDFAWGDGESDPNMLFIKTNGLTVSGTTAQEYIYVEEGASSLTINDLTMTANNSNFSSLTFAGNCTLNFSGNNVISRERYNLVVGVKNLTITGDGKLSLQTSLGGIGIEVLKQGKLTLNIAGELIVSGVPGIYALGGMDIPSCTGKILVYGSEKEAGFGAIQCGTEGVVTLGKEVKVLGTTAITSVESEITQPAYFSAADKGMVVGGVYAGSLLIQKGTPSTPGGNDTGKGGSLTWLWILLIIILLLILIYVASFFIWKKNEELPDALAFLSFLVPSYKAINSTLFKK